MAYFVNRLSISGTQITRFLVSDDAVLLVYFLDLAPTSLKHSSYRFSAFPALILALLERGISALPGQAEQLIPREKTQGSSSDWDEIVRCFCHTDLYSKTPSPGPSHRFYVLLHHFLDKQQQRHRQSTSINLLRDGNCSSVTSPQRKVISSDKQSSNAGPRKTERSLLECMLVHLLSIFEKTVDVLCDPAAAGSFFRVFEAFMERPNFFNLGLLAAKMARTANSVSLRMAGTKDSIEHLDTLGVVHAMVKGIRACTATRQCECGDGKVFVTISLDLVSTLVQVLWRSSKLDSRLLKVFARSGGYDAFFDVFRAVDRAGTLYQKSLLVQHLSQALFILPAPLLRSFSRSFVPDSYVGQVSLSCPFYTVAAQDLAPAQVVSPPSPNQAILYASCRSYTILDPCPPHQKQSSHIYSNTHQKQQQSQPSSPSQLQVASPVILGSSPKSPAIELLAPTAPVSVGQRHSQQQQQQQQPDLVEEVECLQNGEALTLILNCYLDAKDSFLKEHFLRVLKCVFAIAAWVAKTPVPVPLLDPFPTVFDRFDDFGLAEQTRLIALLEDTSYLQHISVKHLSALCSLLCSASRPTTVLLVAGCLRRAVKRHFFQEASLAEAGLFEALATFLVNPLELPYAAVLASNPSELAEASELVSKIEGSSDTNSHNKMDREEKEGENESENRSRPALTASEVLFCVSRAVLRLLALYAKENDRALAGLRNGANFQPLYRLLLVPQVRQEALAVVAIVAGKSYHLGGRVVRGLIEVLYSTGGAAVDSADVLALWTNVLDALSAILSSGGPDAAPAFRKAGGFTWVVSVVELFKKRRCLSDSTAETALKAVLTENEAEAEAEAEPPSSLPLPPDAEHIRAFFGAVLRIFSTAIKGSESSVAYLREELTFETLTETFRTCLAAHALPEEVFVDLLVSTALRDPRSWPAIHRGASAESLRLAVPELLGIVVGDLFGFFTPPVQQRVVADVERIALSSPENVALLSAADVQGRIIAAHGGSLFTRLVDTTDLTGEALARVLTQLLGRRATAGHIHALFVGLARTSFHSRVLRLLAAVAASAPEPTAQPPLHELILSPSTNGILGLRGALIRDALLTVLGGKSWPPKRFAASMWLRIASLKGNPQPHNLFSFTTQGGACVLLRLSVAAAQPTGAASLALTLFAGPKLGDVKTFALEVDSLPEDNGSGEWHHVILSIGSSGEDSSSERRLLRRGQPPPALRLFVDGVPALRSPPVILAGIAASSLTTQLTEGAEFCVGDCPESLLRREDAPCSDIRLGHITFFNECPTDAEVYAMYVAGPDLVVTCKDQTDDIGSYCHAVPIPFRPEDLPIYAKTLLLSPQTHNRETNGSTNGSNASLPTLRRLGEKAATLMFVPRRQSFVVCPGPSSTDVAMTLVRYASAEKPSRGMRLLASSHAPLVAHHPTLWSEIGSAGGVSAVLYVLGVVQTKEQQQAGLELLAALLQGSPANCRAMRACNGYILLARLMKRVVWTLSTDIVSLVLELAGVSRSPSRPLTAADNDDGCGDTSKNFVGDFDTRFDCGALVDADAVTALLLDWGIWKRAPDIVKEALLRSMTYLVTASPYAAALNAPLLLQCGAVTEVLCAMRDQSTSLNEARLLADFLQQVLENGSRPQPSKESVRAIADFLLSTHKRTRMVAYSIGSSPRHYFNSTSLTASSFSSFGWTGGNGNGNSSATTSPQKRRLSRTTNSLMTLAVTPLAHYTSTTRPTSMTASTSELPAVMCLNSTSHSSTNSSAESSMGSSPVAKVPIAAATPLQKSQVPQQEKLFCTEQQQQQQQQEADSAPGVFNGLVGGRGQCRSAHMRTVSSSYSTLPTYTAGAGTKTSAGTSTGVDGENDPDALLTQKRILALEMLLAVLSNTPKSLTQEELTEAFPIESILFMLQHPSTELRSLFIRLIHFCMQAPTSDKSDSTTSAQQQQQQAQTQQQQREAWSYSKFSTDYGFELLGTQLQGYTAAGKLFYALFEFMVGKAFPRNPDADICASLEATVATTPNGIPLEYPQAVSTILMAAASPITSYREQREVVRGLCKVCASSPSSTQALVDGRLIYGVVGLLVSRLEKRKRDGRVFAAPSSSSIASTIVSPSSLFPASPVMHARLDDAFYLAEVPPLSPHALVPSLSSSPTFLASGVRLRSSSSSSVSMSATSTPMSSSPSSPTFRLQSGSSQQLQSQQPAMPTTPATADAAPFLLTSDSMASLVTEETDEDILRLVRIVVLQGAGTKGLCVKRLCDVILLAKATLASERLVMALQSRVVYDVLRQFSANKEFCLSKRSVRNFAQISAVVAEFVRYNMYILEETRVNKDDDGKNESSDSDKSKNKDKDKAGNSSDKHSKSEETPKEGEAKPTDNSGNDNNSSSSNSNNNSKPSEDKSGEDCGDVSAQPEDDTTHNEEEIRANSMYDNDDDDLAEYLCMERVSQESTLKLLLTLLVMVLKSVNNPAARDAAAKSISCVMDTTWRVLLYVFKAASTLQPDFVAWALDVLCHRAVLAYPVLARCVAVMIHISKLHKDPVLGPRARRAYETLKVLATSRSAKVSISLRPSIFRNSNLSRLVDARVLLQKAFGVSGASDALSLPGSWVEDAARWEDDERSLAAHFRDVQRRSYEHTLRTFDALKAGIKRLREAMPGRVSGLQWLVQTASEVPRLERAQRETATAAAAWKAIFAACSHERGPCPALSLHPPFCRRALDATEDSQRQRLRLRWKVSDPTTPTLRPPYAVPELTGDPATPRFPGLGMPITRGAARFCYCASTPSDEIILVTTTTTTTESFGREGNENIDDVRSLPLARRIFPYYEDSLRGGTPVTIQGENFTAGIKVYIGGTPAQDVRLVSATELTAVSPPQKAWGFYEVEVVFRSQIRHNIIVKYGYIDVAGFAAYTAAKNAVTLGSGSICTLQPLRLGVSEDVRRSAAAFFLQESQKSFSPSPTSPTSSLPSSSSSSSSKPLPFQAPFSASAAQSPDDAPQNLRIRSGDKIVFVERVTLISMYSDREGEVVLTSTGIAFFSLPASVSHNSDGSNGSQKNLAWRYDDICEMHGRRYVLRDVAVELFFTTGKTAFIAFGDTVRRDRFWKMVTSMALPNLRAAVATEDLRGGLLTTTLTDRWTRGEISNYEYLMRLNVLAGRTFNDLNQYPVFPWVLADYTSEELDLTDPKTFRDLSKPMGALDEARAKRFAAKYEQLAELGETPYHYGTHYSSSGAVLHYMSRLEPYASYHVAFQSGRFDVPDRLFFDVAATWDLASRSPMGDVKELIPEFFCLPEMFENRNNFDFGERQDGSRVHGVRLPPWAKGSARKFVHIHRTVLESEYVSAHLHEWIDLIFGCKQQSKEALNVFHPYTCEGGIDWDTIKDPVDRLAKQTQVNTWGQTPRKLFSKPHPPRNMKLVQQATAALSFVTPPPVASVHASLVARVSGPITDIVILTHDPAFPLSPPPSQALSSDSFLPSSTAFQTGSGGNAPAESVSESMWGVVPVTDPRRAQVFPVSAGEYITWGHWDGSIRVCSRNGGKVLSVATPLAGTDDEVLVCAAAGQSLFCGTKSGLVLAWRRLSPGAPIFAGHFVRLFGHDGPIRTLEVSAEHNLAISGSSDGTCIIWDTNKLTYVRTLRHRGPVAAVCMSPVNGNIYTLEEDTTSGAQSVLHVWSINGDHMSSRTSNSL